MGGSGSRQSAVVEGRAQASAGSTPRTRHRPRPNGRGVVHRHDVDSRVWLVSSLHNNGGSTLIPLPAG